ncbi:ras guanine nucleotide exchange factor domain-containing protein [Linnemannia elongata]|nr:ras guanine nucleotide exchange factor domain-containing protein [Linnemannia elongata]
MAPQTPQTPPLAPATAANGSSSSTTTTTNDVIDQQQQSTDPQTPQESDSVVIVRALYPYVSEDPNTISLSFEADDLIQVVTQLDSGWWYGFCNQARGWFPSNFVEEITQSDLEDDSEEGDEEGSVDNDNDDTEKVHDHDHDTNGHHAHVLEHDLDDQDQTDSDDETTNDDLWLPQTTADGQLYYFNTRTGDSSWSIPTPSLSRRTTTQATNVQQQQQQQDSKDNTSSTTSLAPPSRPNHHRNDSNGAPVPHTNEDHRSTASRRSTAASISSSTLSGSDAVRDSMTHDQLRQNGVSNGQVMTSSRAMGSVQELTETDSHTGSSRPSSWQASAVPTRVGSPHSQDGLLNHAQASSAAHVRKPSSTGAPGISDSAEGLPPLPVVSNPLDPVPTWASLEEHASATLLNLVHSADNGYKSYYQIQAAQVVESIRVMFYASGMIDKDSAPIRLHGDLKVYHRQIMAALSRLILSAKMASSVWPAEGSVAKMRSDAGEVATAVREFITAAQNANVTVHDVDAKLVANPDSAANATHSSRHSQKLARSLSTVSRPSLDGGDRSSANGSVGGKSSTVASSTVLTPLEYYCKSACRAIGVLSLQITKAVDSVQGSVLQSGPNIMNSAQSSQLVTQCHNAISHTGSLLALVSEYYATVFAEHPDIKDHILLDVRVSRQALYNNVASLVMAIQLATDPMARMSVLEMALEATQTAERSVQDLTAATRALAMASDEMEKGTRTRSASEANISSSDSFLMLEDSDLEGDTIKGTSSRHRRSESRLSSFSSGSSAAPSMASGASGVDTFTRSNAAIYGSSQGSSAVVEIAAANTGRGPTVGNPTDRDQQRARGIKLNKIFGEDVVLSGPKTPKAVEIPWYLQHDHSTTEISFNMEGLVKGGTLPALVERLTLHDSIPASFVATFLLTYRSFTTTTEFFNLLFRRFTIAPPTGLEGQDLVQWTERKLTPIRLRVFNTIKTWLENFYMEDEVEDRQMLPKIKEFSSLMRHSMSFAAVQIIKLVEKREASDGSLRKMILNLTTQAPQPITPRNLKKIKFLELDPLEFARQLTIMEASAYNKIKPVECLAKAWTSEDPEIAAKAVNIKKMIETANLYANWVNELVLSEKDTKKRALIVRQLVAVAEKLRQLNNFSLLYATTAALALSPIHRLKRTWELVPSKVMATYTTLQAVTNSAKSWTDYRQELHSANPPCVPFVGVYLTDLVMIQDGNPDFLKGAEQHINFAKRVSTAEVIREIQQYQSVPYCLTTVPEIQAFIRRGLDQSKPVAELHELSLELEPREGEEEKITRLLAEAGFLSI